MLTQTEANERVKRGAEFLDGKWPEWYAHVDVNVLDLGSNDRCVLGQLSCGDAWDAAHRLWPRAMAVGFSPRVGFSAEDALEWYGFEVPCSVFEAQEDADEARLQDAWVAEIAARVQPVAEDIEGDELQSEPVLVVAAQRPEGRLRSAAIGAMVLGGLLMSGLLGAGAF